MWAKMLLDLRINRHSFTEKSGFRANYRVRDSWLSITSRWDLQECRCTGAEHVAGDSACGCVLRAMVQSFTALSYGTSNSTVFSRSVGAIMWCRVPRSVNLFDSQNCTWSTFGNILCCVTCH